MKEISSRLEILSVIGWTRRCRVTTTPTLLAALETASSQNAVSVTDLTPATDSAISSSEFLDVTWSRYVTECETTCYWDIHWTMYTCRQSSWHVTLHHVTCDVTPMLSLSDWILKVTIEKMTNLIYLTKLLKGSLLSLLVSSYLLIIKSSLYDNWNEECHQIIFISSYSSQPGSPGVPIVCHISV